ncbi:fused MFS/spermidine synthase [Nodosilinea sp. P-1105]|uniref:fused MFS/spermidine synthase n=1 Tax=Nodosilinea sp. P-1105 TaxID=2546229 RepID=UPI00146D6C16|nr:fused MFS/spermidine synthase [Nodosilinea sp. P-1105]NMF84226.1 hypothetical protein [Nodosilinea sp. P-1105]
MPLLLSLFFVSGFAALVYQVMWVRELGLLLGSTAQAAALTVAIFFAGLGSGGWFWGRRAPQMTSSLRGFGWVEIGVAVTALGHFVLIDGYHALYPLLYDHFGDSLWLNTVAKGAIAATLLFPPSFLMGGTLPLMVQHLVRHPKALGNVGTRLYAVNTAGSATGALTAGFILPLPLGFRNAYLLAVALDLTVGLTALLLAAQSSPPPTPRDPGQTHRSAHAPHRQPGQTHRSAPTAPHPPIHPSTHTPIHPHTPSPLPLAFLSGFATLGIEILWTRLFSQVLQNSAYTYALVLSCFLLALAVGAGVANQLIRLSRLSPPVILGTLLGLASLVTVVSAWGFYRLTDGLTYLGRGLGWWDYIAEVAGLAALVVLLPAVVLGTVLPYLMRLLEADPRQPGEVIGRLVAADTVGAIAGSLLTGFVLLPTLGTWRSLMLLAALYPLMLAGLVLQRRSWPRLGLGALAIAAAIALASLTLENVQAVTFGVWGNERLVEVQEGTHATVTVVESGGDRAIRVNSYYTLGSSRHLHLEQNQTVVPLLTHPNPRSVFYLGMGTGITAGAALPFNPEQVVVCELLPEVVDLAERHFGRWIYGLFEDPRVTVYAEDGRNCLSRSRATYDLIISDLFTPWERGTGNLYTLEHYRMALDRLEPDGLYVQWIPLYQVSEREFAIIARTMATVFPQVVVWRGDLGPSRSIVALVGQKQPALLDPAVAVRQGRALLAQWPNAADLPDEYFEALLLRLYVGNLTASGLFADAPLNTDNFPRIEYLAPQTHRQVEAGDRRFLVGREREQLYANLRDATPPDRDPYLAQLTPTQLGYVQAGHSYSQFAQLNHARLTDEAEPFLLEFEALSPAGTRNALSPARQLLP